MFGKGKRKLERDGTQIEGVLIESDAASMEFNKVSSQSTFSGRYKVKVRVTFPDGAKAEFDDKIPTSAGLHDLGSVVPLRYDPDDRTRIQVDEAELESRTKAAEQKVEADLIARGERQAALGAGAPGVGGATASAIEQSLLLRRQLADGTLTQEQFDDEMARLRGGLSAYDAPPAEPGS